MSRPLRIEYPGAAKSVDSKLNSKNSTLPFLVSSLTWDRFIYPRAGKSDKTISAYVEALAIGAQFPPIKIQRVFNYTDGNQTTEATIILDGIHASDRLCLISNLCAYFGKLFRPRS